MVKRHRKRRRIRQKDLSKKSGVSTSYISYLEADNSIRDRTPTLQIIENLATSLEICINDLIFYPCIECPLNTTCNKKEKDMRDPDVISNEILDFYI
jgi:transcriptional regulator with XRE-family HTH domain